MRKGEGKSVAKSSNQKQKLLLLAQLLWERTDRDHYLSVQQMIDALAARGIAAERKSLYDDIQVLRQMGMDIRLHKSKGYCLDSRLFEPAELKLLVDAVQSSKFITYKKSNALIKKLESLSSRQEGGLLQRQVFVSNRIKTMNESIYSNVDKLHEAISGNQAISFQYFEWTVDSSQGIPKIQKKLRHGGRHYQVSPWGLVWEDENYYLIAFDDLAGSIKHFRVDKMTAIRMLDRRRSGEEHFRRFDAAVYQREIFSMFRGEIVDLRLRVHRQLIGVIADRFGRELFLREDGPAYVVVGLRVAVSEQFFGWLFGLGERVQLLSPPSLVEQYRRRLEGVAAQYPSFGENVQE